jgi:hypothetical protein
MRVPIVPGAGAVIRSAAGSVARNEEIVRSLTAQGAVHLGSTPEMSQVVKGLVTGVKEVAKSEEVIIIRRIVGEVQRHERIEQEQSRAEPDDASNQPDLNEPQPKEFVGDEPPFGTNQDPDGSGVLGAIVDGIGEFFREVLS